LKKSYAGAPPQKIIHTQLPKFTVGAPSYLSGLTNFDSRLGQLFENGLKKSQGQTKERERNCKMMPVHHFQVSPCVIIVKYGKCAANLMVSLCIHLELADVIANVSTLKYVIN